MTTTPPATEPETFDAKALAASAMDEVAAWANEQKGRQAEIARAFEKSTGTNSQRVAVSRWLEIDPERRTYPSLPNALLLLAIIKSIREGKRPVALTITIKGR